MTLRTITDAPWYISNFDIHRDMNIPFVNDEIKRFAIRYTNRLDNHINTLAIELLDNSMDVRDDLKDFMFWTFPTVKNSFTV